MSKEGVIQGLAAAAFVAGNFFTAGTLSAFLIVSSMMLSFYAANAGAASDEEQFAQGTLLGTEAPLPVVYGETKVGGRIVDVRVDPDSEDNKDIAVVVAWCLGSEGGTGIQSIKHLWFDDVLVVEDGVVSDEGGVSPETGYSPKRPVVNFFDHQNYLGTHSQTVDSELNSRFTQWPSTSRLRGVAYTRFILTYDEEAYPTGLPRQFRALIRGQKVYDPRTETTGFSHNPALCLLDYLRSDKYGAAIPLDEIDIDSVKEDANYHDEIAGSSTNPVTSASYDYPRARISGAVDTGTRLEENIQRIAQSGRIEVIYESGKFKFHTNKVQTPVDFEFNEDNIIGDFRFDRMGNKDVPTSVTASFKDRFYGWEIDQVTFPEPGDETPFVDADGGIHNNLDINLSMCDDYSVAYNIAQVVFSEGREDQTVSFLADESATTLSVGDVVTATHETPGWDAKKFWVRALGLGPSGNVRVGLVEYDDTAYDFDPSTTVPSNPGTDLPNPFFMEPPTDVTGVSNDETAFQLAVRGLFFPRIFVSWVDPQDEPFFSHIIVRYRKKEADGTPEEDHDPWEIREIEPGEQRALLAQVTNDETYVIEVRAVNTLGVGSEWVEIEVLATTEETGESIAPNMSTRVEYFNDGTDAKAKVIGRIDDPFNMLRDTDPVKAYVKNAPAKTVPDPIDDEGDYVAKEAETSGEHEGRWVWEATLDEKHLAVIAPAMYWINLSGSTSVEHKILWLDVGNEANLIDWSVSYDGTVAKVRVKGDADTDSLHAEEFDPDTETWGSVENPTPAFDGTDGDRFSTDRRGSFEVNVFDERIRELRVFGKNKDDGLRGPSEELEIDRNPDAFAGNFVRLIRVLWSDPLDGEASADLELEVGDQTHSVVIVGGWTPEGEEQGHTIDYTISVDPESTGRYALQDHQGGVLLLGHGDTLEPNFTFSPFDDDPPSDGDLGRILDTGITEWWKDGQGVRVRQDPDGPDDISGQAAYLEVDSSLLLELNGKVPRIGVPAGAAVPTSVEQGLIVGSDDAESKWETLDPPAESDKYLRYTTESGVHWTDLTAVETTREINTGDGLSGGGDLSADRTISLEIPVTVAHGGTGKTDFGSGGMIQSPDGTGLAEIANGTDDQVLTMVTGQPEWADIPDQDPEDPRIPNSPATAGRFLIADTANDNWQDSGWELPTVGPADAQVLVGGGTGEAAQWIGPLNVGRGGTGRTSLTSGNYLVGNGTSQVSLKTASEVLSDIGAAAESHDHSASDITSGTLSTGRGGTGLSGFGASDRLLVSTSSSNLTTIAAGSDGDVLTMATGTPEWAPPTGGTSGFTGTVSFEAFDADSPCNRIKITEEWEDGVLKTRTSGDGDGCPE